jgi:hypothetical protein
MGGGAPPFFLAEVKAVPNQDDQIVVEVQEVTDDPARTARCRGTPSSIGV